MKKSKIDIKFMSQTGTCDDPGIYIRAEKLTMARPLMPVFGFVVSIETAMEMVQGIADALEEYERWDDAETAE